MKTYRIGILTGGGDCAGINPAVKWAVKSALDSRLSAERDTHYQVLGIRNGWEGLMNLDPSSSSDPHYVIPLTEELVRTWDRHGGTNLGTSRSNPYNPKNDVSKTVIQNIERLGLDALIAIGGDDTLGVALRLSGEGVPVVGIPKTIDKDLPGTEYTLGFETAMNVVVECVDRLRTTAGSHRRVFVVETMGRHAGWLALEGGESSGAYIILIPEFDFDMTRVNELLQEGRNSGARYEIVIVAEGAKPSGGGEFVRDNLVDSFGHQTLGGVGEYVASAIHTGTGFETRSIILSHLQRGGVPCAYDRRMGRYFGIAAVDLLVGRDFGKMVAFRDGRVTAIPFQQALAGPHLVNLVTEYDTSRYNGRRTMLQRET
ncbi:MAG: ATP-dependent 6-phosphofructokinase [Dehalococcoidia bacterium]|nr:ATP-dependent 6-phosphofructokinase [Dehalococcoidia bacterium]